MQSGPQQHEIEVEPTTLNITLIENLLVRGGHPDRVRQIYGLGTISATTNTLLSVTLLILTWDVIPTVYMTAWVGIIFAQNAAFLAYQSRKNRLRIKRISNRSLRRLSIFAFTIAVIWMPVPVMVSLYMDEASKILSLAVMGIHVLGASVVFSTIPLLVLIYVTTIFGPVIVVNLYLQSFEGNIVSMVFVALGIILVQFSLQYSMIIFSTERRAQQRQIDIQNLRQAHDNIRRLASTDIATGLANRRSFLTMLETKIEQAVGCREGNYALYQIDLDHFKHVNDAYGHEVGDAFLKEVGDRLSKAAGNKGTAARLGGDEFAILSNAPLSEDEMQSFGAEIRAALSGWADLAGQTLPISGSIGVALAPRDCATIAEWLTFADDGLRHAKTAQRGTMRVFTSFDKDRILEQSQLEAQLACAIRMRSVIPVYQPQIEISSGRLLGFEALARWQNAAGQSISPLRFFEIAERTGQVLDLSEVLFEQVADDVRQARARGLDLGNISLNLHPVQLHHHDRLRKILGIVTDALGDPRRLTLEVTENCVIGRGTEGIPATLEALTREGFQLSLDDFGTGYASLTHIKDLPIQEVKIDRKFIRDIAQDAQDRVIVEAVYKIARPRNIEVIAEGVETAEQLRIIAQLGGNICQGYYYSKPLSAADTFSYVANAKDGIVARSTGS